MPVESGARLAHYEITSLLGKGGMGEVWMAKDTKLGRDVAIKILPEEFTRDAERLARFEREARVLASLDDPGIASIYGIEEDEGVRFLVMQLAEGEDLSERMRRGPIPLDEAIPIAVRLAEGLEAAHDKGIIHRDLKPANIKIDADGKVRILDFGLAKALDKEEGDEDISNSPTMIRAATNAGVILGTAAYMSPEQARGKRVDKRADIWAFGVVLWEMLTGKRLFVGETVSDTLAAVLKEEPDLEALPPSTPASVRRVIRRCLEKNPKQRLHDIADARIELTEGVDETNPDVGGVAAPKRSPLFEAIPWGIAVLAMIVAVSSWLGSRSEAVTPEQLVAKLTPPDGASFVVSNGFAISPDGSRIAYSAQDESGTSKLWVESLRDGSARSLNGTEHGKNPFWSPDGEQLAFFSSGQSESGKLKVVNLETQVVEVLSDARGRCAGAWSESGTIVFAHSHRMHRVSASGGDTMEIETGDSRDLEYLHPDFLPDGKHVLYLARNYYDSEPKRELRVVSLEDGSSKLVKRINSNAVYAPSGEIVWWESGNLRAQAFDLDRLEVVGESRLIAAEVGFDPRVGLGMFAVSRDGMLVYRRGGILSGDELARLDRHGRDLGTVGAPGNFYYPKLSPDGRSVAVDQSDETNRGDIWIYDVERGTGTRLTTDPVDESNPVWSPDGEEIAFFSGRDGRAKIHARSVRRLEDERILYSAEDTGVSPQDWSSQELVLFDYDDAVGGRSSNLAAYDREEQSVVPIAATQFFEANADMSPDNSFVAYDSGETGEQEVYVQTFPESSKRWRVSTQGGYGPVWNADGSEIFYLNQDSFLVVVRVRREGSSLEFGEPEPLFKVDVKELGARQYDTIDGQWFLVNRVVDDLETTPLTIVLHAVGASSGPNSN